MGLKFFMNCSCSLQSGNQFLTVNEKKILHDVEKLELNFLFLFSLTSVRDPWIQSLHYTEIMTKKVDLCINISLVLSWFNSLTKTANQVFSSKCLV